jgi:serine protease Do
MWWLLVLEGWAVDRRTPVVMAVEKATPAVVTVEVEVERQSPFMFGWGTTLASSEGSGVVIEPGGVVLTNAHVVEGAVGIRIRTSSGSSYAASVVALERDTDLAVLRAEGAESLPAIEVGTSRDLMLGETVIAIGNPLGLGLTVSTGVVSSVDRDVEIRPGLHQTFIQTDAAINPGNSGGALVNLEGKLIGINTAIRADAQGIGFAIPIDRASKIAADLVSYGSVRAPWLGVELLDLDRRGGGVLVVGVDPEGPAVKSLAVGDLVTSVAGHAVTSRADVNARLADLKPGDSVPVAYHRDNRAAQVTVASKALPDTIGSRVLKQSVGVSVALVEGRLSVTGASAQGSWARAGLRVGDVILAVDGRRVKSSAELEAAVRTAVGQHRAAALFTVQRGRYQGHVPVEL